MKTYRCPKCKNEISDTKYIKIQKASCKICKTQMIRLHKPNKKQLAAEIDFNKKLQI